MRINTPIKSMLTVLLLLPFVGLTSCDDAEDPVIVDEQELITTVEITFTPLDASSPTTYRWSDPDGDGGEEPVITPGESLKNGLEYSSMVRFLDESGDEVEDITLEVAEKDDEHQVFYITDSKVSFEYNDEDSNGNPIGLVTKLTPLASGSSTLRIVLLHEPMKNNEGVSDGLLENAQGETDIDVSITLEIE